MSHVLSDSRPAPASVQAVPIAAPPSRLLSLDVFRGITIAGMLLVNNPGSWSHVYDPLEHAKWHGWTPTDLIFPFFLFIVGVAMAFSFAAQEAKGSARGETMLRVARRSALLFVLGLVLAAFPFVLFGVNAIAAFFLSGIFARVLGLVAWSGPGGEAVTLKGWLHQTLFASWLSPHDASLAFAISFVLLWMGVMWVFWRRKIFLRV
ncbi:MAG: DUF5009 domain-containing protein [Gemmatimonadota bacterium]|nr:DUF5009 domain-containing protein [Gemmatimonadota bacterium]